MAKLAFMIAALGAAIAGTPAAAQTVVATNFENGTGGFTLTGNVGVTNGAAYVNNAGGTGSAAAQANSFATFGSGNTAGNGLVSNSFTTVAGQLYTLSFSYGAFNSTSQALEYSILGIFAGTLTPTAGTNNLDALFSNFTTTFTGNGQSTSLVFSSLSGAGDNADILLDNISVSANAVAAVPEPTSWALMILGFGAVGSLLRRRSLRRPGLRFA